MKKESNKEEKYNSEISDQEKEMLNQENIHKDGDDDQNLINQAKDDGNTKRFNILHKLSVWLTVAILLANIAFLFI